MAILICTGKRDAADGPVMAVDRSDTGSGVSPIRSWDIQGPTDLGRAWDGARPVI